MTKDEIAEVLRTLSKDEMHTALNFLTGNDPAAVEDALRYVQRVEKKYLRRGGTVYGIRPHLDLSPEDLATQKRMAEEFLARPWTPPQTILEEELGPELWHLR